MSDKFSSVPFEMYREQFEECAYWCQDLKTLFFQHDFELLIFLNKTKFIQSIYLKEKNYGVIIIWG